MKWLVEIRGKRTQQAIADQIGISQSGYASIESGTRQPSVKMAKQIGAALGFNWTVKVMLCHRFQYINMATTGFIGLILPI